MEYWDYCVREEALDGDLMKNARLLGFSGICVLAGGKPAGCDGSYAVCGRLVEAAAGRLRGVVRAGRKGSLIIAVEGRDDETNRAACEAREVDILIPGPGTKIDVTMARFARDNGVRIAFEFAPLLHSSLVDRGRVFSQMRMNAKSVVKAKAPFVVSSGALSGFGLRSPSDLVSFAKVLGFPEPAARRSMGGELMRENARRLSGKWVMPGVEVEG